MNIRPRHAALRIGVALVLILLASCKKNSEKEVLEERHRSRAVDSSGITLVILGTIQDAGSPQIGCEKECCKDLFGRPDPKRKVVSLGLIDKKQGKSYLFEATPDIADQVHALNLSGGMPAGRIPDGIFLTHAHIGHYTGLMFLGKEAVNAAKVPVYAMPRMAHFLQSNGPWSQLVTGENIQLSVIKADSAVVLSPEISIIPFRVPHRDEYSETVGFEIRGPEKKVLFIPDIDKWERWEQAIEEKIAGVDYAFLDATFYSGDEMNTRDISEIPHPFVIESSTRFRSLTPDEKKKIHFIHFNHTNPLLSSQSQAYKTVTSEGFHVASYLQEIEL